MQTYSRAFFIVMICLGPLCAAYGRPAGNDKAQTMKKPVQETARQMETQRKVVFHLDADEVGRLVMALENTKNLFKEIPPQQCQVRMVANGKAVNLFRKDRTGKYASDMEELHKAGVRFKVCRNAMARSNMNKADLFEACEVVPAGILELIDLQALGFAYIKP